MPEPTEDRVAVYIDFDNIVISRYDQLHGGGRFHKDKARRFAPTPAKAGSEVATRLAEATVDLGAVLDFASSFGSIVVSRAYADWSVPVNAGYQRQLIDRAVDLVQLFPTVVSMKNGADIRLAVDVVEDLFRLPDLTHIVIVAGDSDYIALAQRCKRLGRYVIGIGVAGGTSRSLAAACDEFADYDALPGISPRDASAVARRAPDTPVAEAPDAEPDNKPDNTAAAKNDAAAEESPTADASSDAAQNAPAGSAKQQKSPATTAKKGPRRATSDSTARQQRSAAEIAEAEAATQQESATALLMRALRLGHAKDDAEWLHSSSVKTQMKRMDPSFQEAALGFRSFSAFVKSRADIAELDESSQTRRIRLRPELMAQ
ncbi:MAG: NYN domain-containing protein [Microbacteriaceae bacterium]